MECLVEIGKFALVGAIAGMVTKNPKVVGACYALGEVINIIAKGIIDPRLEKARITEYSPYRRSILSLMTCASGLLAYQVITLIFKSAITPTEMINTLPYAAGLFVICG